MIRALNSKLSFKPTTVTEENIESLREQLPGDQARELQVGCITWKFDYVASNIEGIIGVMTIWPCGRGAIEFGGGSLWGEWDYQDEELTIDEGYSYSRSGIELRD